MNLKARFVSLALLASVATGTTACTDSEVASFIGGVVIGVIVSDDDGHGHHHGHCQPGYREVCREWRDYYGRRHRDCRSEYDSCAYTSSVSLLANSSFGEELVIEPTVTESNVAEKFGLSAEGARKFVSAFEAAQNKDLKPILDLGLSREDVEELGRYSMPSDTGIDALARSLDQHADDARAMVRKLLDKAIEKRDAQRNLYSGG